MENIALITAAIVMATSTAAHAEPQYKLNRKQTEVVALSKLSSDGVCILTRMSGRVVARQFATNGVALMTFAIEEKSGDRTLVNIDDEAIGNASRLTQAWVVQGLQRMIREGKNVNIGVQFCGAAGRVAVLDSIKAR